MANSLRKKKESCGNTYRMVNSESDYLPGSDKQCITQTETTMVALKQAVEWVRPGGLVTVAVYPGHEGGAEEAVRIAEWAGTLDARAFEVQHLRPVNRTAAPPECWVIWKRGF